MSEKTGISWCDATFNPWWGCIKVSEACRNCYALDQSKRYGHNVWGPAKTTPRRLFGEKHWAEPLRWDAKAAAEGRRWRVFCAFMADVFEDHPQLPSERERLWRLIEETPNLDWLLLTKRPENVRAMVLPSWVHPDYDWPRNVWLGTSVENQQAAERRLPHLLEVPAACWFLSCEPLLGHLYLRAVPDPRELSEWRFDALAGGWYIPSTDGYPEETGDGPEWGTVAWVITGGESGPHFRPIDPDWVRSLRDQCTATGAAFHLKQWSSRFPGGAALLDGREWKEFPAVGAAPELASV